MAPVRRVVLDVLKPHEPSTVELSQEIAGAGGVAAVNATVLDVDRDVESIKLTIEGEEIDLDDVETVIDRLGASMHSIDQVICGERIVEEQDIQMS